MTPDEKQFIKEIEMKIAHIEKIWKEIEEEVE